MPMRLRHTIGFSLALLVMSGGAVSKPALADDHSHRAKKHHLAENKAKPAKPARLAEHRHRPHDRAAIRAAAIHTAAIHTATIHTAIRHRVRHHSRDDNQATNEDRIIGQVRPIGAREVGTASWYGGRHIGRRTASGERLDAIHDTAAHRSLPLQSLARVTNLNNGRSVIVRVTDRGPVSRRLVIDLSPSAAEELDMKQDGIVPVAVEPVALVADATN